MLLLLLSVLVLLLLNGQYFTNAVVSMSLIALSAVAWLSLTAIPQWRSIAWCMVVVHGLILAAVVQKLPELHGKQARFNEMMNEMGSKGS